MTTQDAATLASTYFEAWKAKDFDTLRSLLADDATFRGPLGSADDAEACLFVDGPDVLTWFDLHTTVAPPAPTANWMRTENGKIKRIRVTFDARPLAPPGAA